MEADRQGNQARENTMVDLPPNCVHPRHRGAGPGYGLQGLGQGGGGGGVRNVRGCLEVSGGDNPKGDCDTVRTSYIEKIEI